MTRSDIKIEMQGDNWQETVAKICSCLVMQGVMFHAHEYGKFLYIEFTGGF